ncbi:hypothetical protein [Siphonobacter sp. SORGH_AS_0500]|uniref:hypothetical protein n=1 Tax=Siphonobacter sp. SORGH_AS_0500 TaxID=1864824 RepID=UPI00285FBC81|nr:hypothetical protein [Siphonobacter sp. SORGH_AS_0500]MDR6194926.1 hypothetical protein [Siphonobacter sp. SORGH_AS_0500]
MSMTPQQIDQLYKLGRLKQDGSITEQQFNEETQKVKDWKYELNPDHPCAHKEGWASLPWEIAIYSETRVLMNILLRIESQMLLGDKEKIWEDYLEISRRTGWATLETFHNSQGLQANSLKASCNNALAELSNNQILTEEEAKRLFSIIKDRFPSMEEEIAEIEKKQEQINETMQVFDALTLLNDKGLIQHEEYMSISSKMRDKYLSN